MRTEQARSRAAIKAEENIEVDRQSKQKECDLSCQNPGVRCKVLFLMKMKFNALVHSVKEVEYKFLKSLNWTGPRLIS